MKNTLTFDELQAEIARLTSENSQLKNRVSELEILNNCYLEQLRLAQVRRFGASSEKNLISGQLSLDFFDEAEAFATLKNIESNLTSEPDFEEITYKHRKTSGKRDEFYSGLPTERIIHVLPEENRLCPECGEMRHACGHDTVRREVVIIPAQIKAVEHIQTVYSCRNCEKNSDGVPIIKADVPTPVIKNSGVASPSLLAYILSNKYGLALPLYRQEQEFKRLGLDISRQTMANWVVFAAMIWLKIIYNILKIEIVKNDILHADESTVQVLREEGRSAAQKSFEWMYHTGRDAEKPIALFEYKPTREGQNAIDFLTGFNGYLHCDGYIGYKKLEEHGVIIVECWGHARRKFADALKSLPKDAQDDSRAAIGLRYCDALFKLERTYDKENLTYDERKMRRERESASLADEFFAWAESMMPQLPKSVFGKVVIYAVNQKKWLVNFLEDGRLELSNNRAERSIRPFTIGRKNWLFSCSQSGATASSIVYSIVETAYATDVIYVGGAVVVDIANIAPVVDNGVASATSGYNANRAVIINGYFTSAFGNYIADRMVVVHCCITAYTNRYIIV